MSEVEATQIKYSPDIHDVDDIRERLNMEAGRLSLIEDRVSKVEVVTAEIPQLKARMSRVDSLLLELQGDMRRLERTTNDHSRLIEAKLDDIRNLILTKLSP